MSLNKPKIFTACPFKEKVYYALSKCLNYTVLENNKIVLSYFRKIGVVCYALIGNHERN